MLKLLRPFTGAGAVFFPIGLPPKGTCQFATPKCIASCYAEYDVEYDEEVRISQKEKWQIYKYFMECPIEWVCDKVKEEIDGLQTPIFHWFGSGDCQTKNTDRILAITNFMSLNHPDIVQMGFTRNIKLWEARKDVFALTVENDSEIKNRDGMFSVPDYKKQVSVMTAASYRVRGGHCGPGDCTDPEVPELSHNINCQMCLRMRTGCFDNVMRGKSTNLNK